METTTEKRERLNESLAFQADLAASELAETQQELAEKLTKGNLLEASTLERLARAQARADIWARVTRTRTFWADNPAKAPERADLVEAVHATRQGIVRESLNYQGGTSASGMSNELDKARQAERQSFLRSTGQIYPAGSPLRDLGNW